MTDQLGRSDAEPNAMALADIEEVAQIAREDGGFDKAYACTGTGNVYRVRLQPSPMSPPTVTDKDGLAATAIGYRLRVTMVEIDPTSHEVERDANGRIKLWDDFNVNVTPEALAAAGDTAVADILMLALRRHIYDANLARTALVSGDAFLASWGLDPMASQPVPPPPPLTAALPYIPPVIMEPIVLPQLPAPTTQAAPDFGLEGEAA